MKQKNMIYLTTAVFVDNGERFLFELSYPRKDKKAMEATIADVRKEVEAVYKEENRSFQQGLGQQIVTVGRAFSDTRDEHYDQMMCFLMAILYKEYGLNYVSVDGNHVMVRKVEDHITNLGLKVEVA